MLHRPRGRALIINNEFFIYSSRRGGCENDVADLKKLFSAIHFQVEVCTNMRAQVIPHCSITVHCPG